MAATLHSLQTARGSCYFTLSNAFSVIGKVTHALSTLWGEKTGIAKEIKGRIFTNIGVGVRLTWDMLQRMNAEPGAIFPPFTQEQQELICAYLSGGCAAMIGGISKMHLTIAARFLMGGTLIEPLWEGTGQFLQKLGVAGFCYTLCGPTGTLVFPVCHIGLRTLRDHFIIAYQQQI